MNKQDEIFLGIILILVGILGLISIPALLSVIIGTGIGILIIALVEGGK